MNKIQKSEQAKSVIDNCRIELRDMGSEVFISPHQRKMYFDAREMLTKLSNELSLNIMALKEEVENE